MSEDKYFLLQDDAKIGPLDSVDIIKRIRNGKLDEHSAVYLHGEDEPIAVGSISPFAEYFLDETASQAQHTDTPWIVDTVSALDLLKTGMNEVSDAQETVIFAGGYSMLLVVIAVAVSSIIPAPIISLAMSLLAGFGLFLFMAFILCKLRGQEASSSLSMALKERFATIILPVLLSSLILLGLPGMLSAISGIGAFIVVALMLIVFMMLMFAPFYWLDGRCNGFASFAMSWKWVTCQKPEIILTVMSIGFLTAVSAMVFLVPFFVVLPISAFALADLYERFAIHMPDKA